MIFRLILFICCLFSMSSAFCASSACSQGTYRVKAHARKGYYRSDGVYVKSAFVKTYCKSFTKAEEYAFNRFKDELPLNWPHHQEKARPWTSEEKDKVLKAFNEIPDGLLSENLVGIYRSSKSKDYPNPSSSAPGIIVVYDSAFDHSRHLARIISHELAHQNYNDLIATDQKNYRDSTGWHLDLGPDGRNIYWFNRKNGYVEPDGETSYQEDYANNLEYFLYDPDKLKKVTPKAYEWIKKHFGDTFKLNKGGHEKN